MLQMMYENMRVRVENVVQEGTISRDYMTNEGESEAFSRWTDEFTPQNHPPVVQVYYINGTLIYTKENSGCAP